MKVLLLLSSPAIAVLVMVFGVVVVLGPVDPSPQLSLAASGCLDADAGPVLKSNLDQQQVRVARTIIGVGKELKVPARGWVIAVATGLQESGLRPLTHGDRDSLGVFQQRAGWGARSSRIDPRSSARMFFSGGAHGQRGLLGIAGWQRLPLTVAAQAVQKSAYPDAYAKWETLAVKVVGDLAHVDARCANHGPWVMPIGAAPYVLTAGFGECGGRWAHCHTGQDFAVPTGTPIVAASAGVVTFAGTDGPYGNLVRILHPGGIATWYGHLSQIQTQKGAQVSAGDLIGLSGATGNTTGPHLHLEVREGASAHSAGSAIDPLPWLHHEHVL